MTEPEISRRTLLAGAAGALLGGSPLAAAPPRGKLDPARMWLKALGKAYGIRSRADRKCFDALWPLYKQASRYARKHKAELNGEVTKAFTILRQVAGGSRVSELGHSQVIRLTGAGRYVVFSDHHMLHAGHRHDYFRSFGNVTLYRQALAQYAGAGYVLIENGDVEDLVVIEPELQEARRRAAMSPASLAKHRLAYRSVQLEKIISTYEELYDQIARDFHAHGRLVKLAGNHEQDLQDPRLLRILRKKYPGLRVHDYAVIAPGRRATPSHIVAHGHQFDPVCNPRYSKQVGEVISECVGWAFQGADRIWTSEDTARWRRGDPFRNEPATARPRRSRKGLKRLWEAIAELAVGHEIAWEYFESKSPQKAVFQEVLKGKEFFKIRHMSEDRILEGMRTAFRGTRRPPTLVLGHSHEARDLPNYMNSGSAGRFEGLLWGVEIDRGASRVITWHHDANGHPVRRILHPKDGRLAPARGPGRPRRGVSGSLR